MTGQDNGGPAFPGESVVRNGMHDTRRMNNPGMSLRDWFAGQALANPRTFPGDYSCAEDVAGWAYGIADAMIAERYK